MFNSALVAVTSAMSEAVISPSSKGLPVDIRSATFLALLFALPFTLPL
jgi:hypothetical protein